MANVYEVTPLNEIEYKGKIQSTVKCPQCGEEFEMCEREAICPVCMAVIRRPFIPSGTT